MVYLKNKYISKIIFNINHYLGWRNWAVLTYNSVFENMFVLFYIALRQRAYATSFIMDILIFLLFSVLSTSYGYLINDLSDKKLDEIHHKDNTFKNDSFEKSLMIVLGFLFASLICGMRFSGSKFFVLAWVVWIIIATQYSFKPLRLKEKGKLGLILVVVAQRLLPTLLIFFAFSYFDILDVSLISIYIFFRGLSSDINHQIQDYDKDKMTATTTCAVEVGIKKIKAVFRFSLEMEKLLLIPVLYVMSIKLFYPVIFMAILLYLVLYFYALFKSIKIKDVFEINPFLSGRKDIFQIIHHAFPTTLLAVALLIVLVSINAYFIVFFVLLILFRLISYFGRII